MYNIKITKVVLIFILVIFVTAICVNYILSREIVCNYNVTGEGKDWIGFYGSIFGGSISAIIAYIVMFHTIENNNRNIVRTLNQSKQLHLITERKSELEFLRKDLSERIGSINVSDILRISMFPEKFDVKEELERLNSLYEKYQTQSNSSLLYYGNIEDAECQLFFNKYNEFLSKICDFINNITNILAPYQYTNDISTLSEKLIPYSNEINKFNHLYKDVFGMAQSFYLKKKQELDKSDYA